MKCEAVHVQRTAVCCQWPVNVISSTLLMLSAARKHKAGLLVCAEEIKPGRRICCSVRLPALVFVQIQFLHLLLQKGNGHGASSGSLWQCVDLSLRRCADKAVSVAPSLLLLFRRPNSGVRLGGAVGQRRIAQIVFDNGGPLVVFCVVRLGENKGLLLRTQAVGFRSRIRSWSTRAGASRVFVLLQALSSHLISAVPVTVYPTVLAVIALLDDSPQKSSTGVTEGRAFVRSLVEVVCVIEVVAQLGTYRHSPDEVRRDFLTADLSLPGKVHHQR